MDGKIIVKIDFQKVKWVSWMGSCDGGKESQVSCLAEDLSTSL